VRRGNFCPNPFDSSEDPILKGADLVIDGVAGGTRPRSAKALSSVLWLACSSVPGCDSKIPAIEHFTPEPGLDKSSVKSLSPLEKAQSKWVRDIDFTKRARVASEKIAARK
jgi:hypothetical protein